ncbi:MAG: MerR family transcriptional regulator [Bacteroidia bacterium]
MEEPSDKLFYTITEVAELFKVNASLIRFWEKEFEFLKPRKTAKGNRTYTQKDIENIHLVYHLVKEKGFTLQGAKDKLTRAFLGEHHVTITKQMKKDNMKEKPTQDTRSKKQDATKNAEVIESLNKLKALLLELKGQL